MILEDFGIPKKKLIIVILLFGTTLTILTNVAFVHLSMIGTITSCIYVMLVGSLLGKIFLRDEDDALSRFMFGIFLAISLLIFIGTPIVIFYELNVQSLAVILLVPLILLSVGLKFQRLNLAKSRSITKKRDDAPFFSPVYIIPLLLVTYADFLVIRARSGWIYGTIWDVVSPSFFIIYFLAAFSLFGVILYCKTKTTSKMLLVTVFSLLSITIPAVVLYPGDIGDSMGQMGGSRLILDYGNLRTPLNLPLGPWFIYWLLKRQGLSLLTAIVVKMFVVDVYWVHTFITAVLWGVFVPLVAYKIIKIIGEEERVSVLAAFLVTFFSPFLIWGSISTQNSLGYAFFFVSLYFSARYLRSDGKRVALALATFVAVASGFIHLFTGVISVTFLVLALYFRKYRTIKIKSPREAYVLMFVSFVASLLVLQFVFVLQNVVYLYFASPAVRENYLQYVIAFSTETFLKTDLWSLIFGEYVGFSFKDVFLVGVMPFLGFVGLVYSLGKKEGFERILTLFLFLAIMICQIDYTIMKYAMINVPFGPGRILVMRDLVAIPFMAVTVNSCLRFLQGRTSWKSAVNPSFKALVMRMVSRQAAAYIFIGLSLAALATSSAYRSYSFGKTLHPTQLEVEAVKYIDEHSDGKYVVLSTNTWMTGIGEGFVGALNPAKRYIYKAFLYPSVAEMLNQITTHKATVGYFVVPSFRVRDFDEVIVEAARNFGLFKVLSNENGEIYIFYYKIPPLPEGYPNTGADVMAFYWDAPPSYMIQNGFARVIFNPQGRNLDVRDFWGDLYESIDLNEMLTDGRTLGNLTSVEYFESSYEKWIEWATSGEVISTERFEFKLNFESESLIGIVEKGRPFVQLRYEGTKASSFRLQLGDFERLYIPGLVGGENPHNVSSREFGLLYTLSRTEDVMLRPAYESESAYSSSLTFSQIVKYCNLTTTERYFQYDLFMHNNASVNQWATIEVWIPDEIYLGISPFMSSSVDDGETWIGARAPIKTLGGADVNWVVSMPGNATQKPVIWSGSREGIGGTGIFPENFTDSSGGQNRLFFGVYLPARDMALVRLTVVKYALLEITYVFRDSDLSKMKEDVIKLYNYGTSAYVGGLASSMRSTSLTIVEDWTGKTKSILITIPSDATFSLLFAKGDTTIDLDKNGIPDFIEG